MSISWSLEGEYMEACSCNFLCPCITQNATTPATEDFCKVAMTFVVDKGQFGTVALDGVKFSMLAESPAIMADGNWVMGVVIDDDASDEQADAIAMIASGKAGGPLAGFAALVGEFRGVERHPISFERVDHRRTVRIPKVLEQSVQGVASLSAPGECIAIDNTFHPVNRRLNLALAARNFIGAFGIRWDDHSNRRNGHFAPFSWQGRAA